jgi:hypothetical protein
MADNNPIERQAQSRANMDLERLIQVPWYDEAPSHPSGGVAHGSFGSQPQDELTAADAAGLPTHTIRTCTNNNQTNPILLLRLNYQYMQVSLMCLVVVLSWGGV